MKLTIGFSPCPNDTFIFDALINQKIETAGITFEPLLEDVETLNALAQEQQLDITKLSFPAFFTAKDKYALLNAGSALGKGVGPLLISKEKKNLYDVEHSKIAIPGLQTTANLLLSFAYPFAQQKIPMLFSTIEDAVINGETDLGVIIHENRFTYQQRGLYKVADLGEYWENKMNIPIPLGGIAVSRKIDHALAITIDGLIRKSLEYAFANYPLITTYVKEHSQAMQEDVTRQHIDLYVNNYSIDLGKNGKSAIAELYKVFCSINNVESADPAALFF
jgi:1,4-dihydroxy-6-naphthoate synthase